MAYLDLREPIAASAELSPIPSFQPTADPVPGEPIGFARNEWDVILLARRDRLASLYEPTRLARLAARLFGGSFNRTLADPRLEALRRLSVHAWHHGYVVPPSAIRAFGDAGFNNDQLELLLASIATSRANRPGRAYA